MLQIMIISNLLKDLDEHGCPPNDYTYNLMIRGFIRNKDMPRALQLVKEMVAKGFSADASTFELFVSLVANGNLDASLQPVT